MKAILVIEMLDDIDISKLRIGGDGNIYYTRDGEKASIVGNIRNIKPLPQRQAKDNSNEVNLGFELGWNACLEEIENG